jgi:predicted GIY-YIG superfamily endonuclease
MNSSPETIQIFLPGGDPNGIRIAEITTRIVQIIEVPRPLLKDFLSMPEGSQVAVYFLIGQSESGSSETVYIGQTGDLRSRLADHNKKKDFWERALILISRTNSLTQTHAVFLEWHCIQELRRAGRFNDENGNAGSRPHTPAPLEADCFEIFETGSTLLSTLGYPLFSPISGLDETASEREIFFCKGGGNDGKGEYTNEGFVVFKGSKARKDNAPSLGDSGERLRSRLIESGVQILDGDYLIFQKDYLFGSPSMAALTILGRRANGWIEWKDASGRTLDALKRQTT